MTGRAQVGAVLFDLDGTLLDTAPDMVAILNQLRIEEAQPRLPYGQARAYVSNGVLGLLRFAFGELPDDTRTRLQQRYLTLYAGQLAVATTLFTGMSAVRLSDLTFSQSSSRCWPNWGCVGAARVS